MIEVIAESDIQQRYYLGNFKILKIETSFPILEFKRIIDHYISNYGTRKKDGYQNYRAIALQYADQADQFFDSIMSSDYAQSTKKIYSKKNSLALELNDIFAKLDFIRLSRGRVIIADPGFKMVEHVDGAHINTLHIPIVTDENAKIVIDGEEFHLPADGSIYLVNATIPHYAYNDSVENSRMHITFPIGPPSFKKWKRSQIINMNKYFEMMQIDISKFGLEIMEDN